jgi:hypothetical protein
VQDDDDAEFEQYETGGAMKVFLEQVYKRLKLEITGKKMCETKWLMKHLEERMIGGFVHAMRKPFQENSVYPTMSIRT